MRLFFFITGLASLALISSCQAPQEKKGASAIPVNRPAAWENNMTPGMN